MQTNDRTVKQEDLTAFADKVEVLRKALDFAGGFGGSKLGSENFIKK
jgi:hypothetical protein